MKKVTAICDHCGFKKTYDKKKYDVKDFHGWAYIHVVGPYADIEICPECLKSFLGVAELKEEEEEDDKNNN